jgi:hypothetical protein
MCDFFFVFLLMEKSLASTHNFQVINPSSVLNNQRYITFLGYAVAQLRYEPESRGFDSQWCHNHSGRTMDLGSNQPLAEMNTRNISWGIKAAGAYS